MDRRNFPRRDLPNHRARPVPYQRRHANNNPSYKAVAPRKGARIVKKKVTKQAKSKEALDMELDTYMGNDAIKSRLDEELAKYIAEGNKEKE
ncbi:hypothetical protein X943_003891 [Babesia divergens]|uniref:Chromatin target of PRMT1 protein C-terminal domain-containing protein n=1 Tax=Babesia divergens TaxID=32595 RepID=A0AAD9GIE7_BABDI|nr:hypothetical protein X943_003891 [Babesia divergens]